MTLAASGELRKMRVAFREEPSYAERTPDGRRTGFAVEMVNALAARCGWDVEWVDAPWGECLKMMKAGKFDVMPYPINVPVVRAGALVGHVPIGYWRMCIFTLSGSPLDGRDRRSLSGIVIGVPRSHVMMQRLEEYLRDLGVKAQFREYSSRRELERALFSGEVGAIFSEANDTLQYEKVLFALPSEPMYMSVAPNRQDLLDEIDTVLGSIVDNEPEFMADLRRRYSRYDRPTRVVFTAREQTWLEQQQRRQRVIWVDLSPVDGYFKRRDVHNGAMTGFAVRLLEEFSRLTGLEFAGLPPSGVNPPEGHGAAAHAELLMPYGGADGETLKPADGFHTVSMTIPQAVASRRRNPVDMHHPEVRIAVSKTDSPRLKAYRDYGAAHRLVLCDNVEAAFEAMASGRADCMVGDYPVLRRLVDMRDDADLFDLNAGFDFRYRSEFPILVDAGADVQFVSVLSKVVGSISRHRLMAIADNAVAQDSEHRGIPFRKIMNVVVPVVLLLLIAGLVVMVVIRRKMKLLLHRLQMSLEMAQKSVVEAGTAQGQLREELEKAEYIAQSKTNFLATMSHEIRTPLNAVIGYSEMLADPAVTPEKVKEYSRGILLSANALLSLINDVLDISKFESGKHEGMDLRTGECDLKALFEEMRSIFTLRSRNKGLEITFDIAEDFPVIALDEPRFRQVMFNLVGNAFKFTDHGGIEVAADFADGTLEFSVKDTGIGITHKGLKHIFDPFAQDMESRQGRIYTGTGLGLPIVKRLVEASDGEVSVESEVGKGSLFTVRIPGVRVLERATPAPVPAASRPKKGAIESVVIVDDMAMNRKILELHCQSLGIKAIKSFASGQEVVDHLAAGNLPDVVLSDMWMPGMDGSQLAKIVADRWPEVPVVAVTADTDPGEKFDISAFESIMAKPVTGAKLKEVFARLCDS